MIFLGNITPHPCIQPKQDVTSLVLLLIPSLPSSFFKLIQCKADTNAANEHGNTPLHYACFWGQDQVAEVGAPPGGVNGEARFLLYFPSW